MERQWTKHRKEGAARQEEKTSVLSYGCDEGGQRDGWSNSREEK